MGTHLEAEAEAEAEASSARQPLWASSSHNPTSLIHRLPNELKVEVIKLLKPASLLI